MKIVQLQYKLSQSGDFARRFHQEYLRAGIESKILSLHTDIPLDSDIQTSDRKHRLKAKIDIKLQKYLTRYADTAQGLFSFPVIGNNICKHKFIQNADIIVIHWVLHGFLSIKNLHQLAKLGRPIVFILHDMWALTGGCHYSGDCKKYEEECSYCPFFKNHKVIDLARINFKNKKTFYSKYDNIYFVSPSNWLAQCSKRASLTKNIPVFHIPNLLNRRIFKRFDSKFARTVLNIGHNEVILAFGAVSIKSPYKGWKYLLAALEKLYLTTEKKVTILVFGGGEQGEISEQIPFDCRMMGKIQDEFTMSLIYNAADVFIAPSLNDNLPYTIFESLACGTPVVAFDTGGIPELVKHKQNGYLAEYKNSSDLSTGIEYCLQNNLSVFVPQELETELNTRRQLDLFADLIQKHQ